MTQRVKNSTSIHKDAVQSLALHCSELWCRLQTHVDLELLWLWRRPAATALMQPVTWKLPYATCAALQKKKKRKRKKRENRNRFTDTKNRLRLVVAKGKGGGGGNNWEFWIRGKLLHIYIGWVNNKVLFIQHRKLYSISFNKP